MAKKVIISIRPEFFTMVYLRKKTFELRKSYPKEADAKGCEIEVLVYCCGVKRLSLFKYVDIHKKTEGMIDRWQGKIAAKFVLKNVYTSKYVSGDLGNGWQTNECPYHEGLNRPDIESVIGISYQEAEKYAGDKTLYLWKIDGFEILEQPKDISEFSLKRPPQSWCYVPETQQKHDYVAPTQQEMEEFWENK